MSNKTESGTDLQQLKALALAADPISTDLYGDRYMQGSWSRVDLDKEQDAFVTALTPAVVLDLIARIERAASGATASGDELPDGRGRFLTMVFDMRQAPVERVQEILREAPWVRSCWSDAMTERDEARAAVSVATKPTADMPKTWQERIKRFGNLPIGTVTATQNDCMREEIAELRSLLATKPAAPADRNDILEEAAKLCEEMEGDMFDQYKGRGKHAPNNPYRADPYMNGQSDGAGQCANAIRSMMSAPAAPMASADAVTDEFTITGNVCEMGRLDDENGEHGLVIKRESDFVTIKGLKISELQVLSRVAFDDVVVSIRPQAADAQGADK